MQTDIKNGSCCSSRTAADFENGSYCSNEEKYLKTVVALGNSMQTDFESGCQCYYSNKEKYLKTGIMGIQCRQSLRVELIVQAKLVLRELNADRLQVLI